MNYYNEIKDKLIDNEIYEKVKDYSKERHRLMIYYEVGKLLSEAGKEYGKNIIGEYSKKLTKDLKINYTKSSLYNMLNFYNFSNKLKFQTVSGKLTYSHYIQLLSIDNIDEIKYYIQVSEKQNLSVRELRNIIKSKEYERLPEETKIKLIESKELGPLEEVKNPIIIKNKYNIAVNPIKEKVLKQLILDDIPSFLRQLGNGYSFIDSEYKIKFDDSCNYIDLLLYNYIYKCFVVVELKVTELKKEHIGQVQVYMNYIDENLRNMGDNKTIGLIVVKENNEYIIKYSSDKRIHAVEYNMEV